MKFYDVTILFGASAGCTVEAENPEQAASLAEDQLDGVQRVCRQCAEKINTGDAYAAIVCEENGDQVLDTRDYSETILALLIQRDALLADAKNLERQGFFQPNSCATSEQSAAMKAMLGAISSIEGGAE